MLSVRQDSTEIINLLMNMQYHFFHGYASLLAKITSLLDHISGVVFKHVLCEGSVCVDFLARLGRNSTLGIRTWGSDGLLLCDITSTYSKRHSKLP